MNLIAINFLAQSMTVYINMTKFDDEIKCGENSNCLHIIALNVKHLIDSKIDKFEKSVSSYQLPICSRNNQKFGFS